VIRKIKIIPHGVDLNLFYPKEKPDKCIFIANKGLRGPEDRGGIQYLIKAYMEEFNDEDVELILRINPAYGLINMEQLMSAMNIEKKEKYPKITINDKPMEYKDLVKFYNQGTVFVSPSRGDAFNIPCIEAMACGMPVITTNFGGQAEFCNETNSWIIGGEMAEVKWDMMYEGISWLTPDINQLKKMMREAFNNPEQVQRKGIQGVETAKQFTWENSAKQLINLS
jgi:glycosyltransferase involved in cell wall biosynthesis